MVITVLFKENGISRVWELYFEVSYVSISFHMLLTTATEKVARNF